MNRARFWFSALLLPAILAGQARPTPPTRDPNTPGFVTAKELPDGNVPPIDVNGNFIIGPTHLPAFESVAHEGVPRGTLHTFTMSSADSRIYPGIAREPGTFGTVDPGDPAKLIVTTSHPAAYTRRVAVYVPKQYVPGTAAPPELPPIAARPSGSFVSVTWYCFSTSGSTSVSTNSA